MSITRALLRIATVHALIDKTLAGDAVFDSIIDPLDARISEDGKRPIIAVYTDDQGGDPTGRGDYLHGDDLDLVLEIVCAGRVQVVFDEEDGGQTEYQLSIPNTDSGLEIMLDLIEAQAIQALTAGAGEWSEIWRLFSLKVSKVVSKRGASTEGGTRFAARQLTITTDTLTDPDRGTPLDESGPWMRALRLLSDNPDTASIAEILLAELEGKPKAEWRRAAARLGVNLSTVSALGIGPIAADDPVLLRDGSVINEEA